MMLIVGLAIAGYFVYQKYAGDGKKSESAAGSPDPGTSGDTITITDNGSKKETYVAIPHGLCRGIHNDPSWCENITPATEMEYVYDPVGGGVDESGNFTTTFNTENFKCSDGTTDCVFGEKFDNNRKLTGITNAKGEDFIQKLIDDLWSGKLVISQSAMDILKNKMDYDGTTGELYILRNGERNKKVVPGIWKTKEDSHTPEGHSKRSVGHMIINIIFQC